MDGNVWWDQTLGVFSHTRKGVSFILHLKLSTFLSSKVLPLLHLLLDQTVLFDKDFKIG